MSATRGQQIGIWIIAVTLTVGTLGSFFAIILANDNQKIDTATTQEEYDKQLKEYEAQQKAAAQANADNSEPLDGYAAATFDAAAVTELKTEVLVAGSGEEIKETDTIKASYFGYTSDGKIFDSSNKKDADNAAISFSLQQVIKGWTNGLKGQKVGSTVKLTIPADQAYGESGSGIIPANAPLEFIVQIDSIDNTTES